MKLGIVGSRNLFVNLEKYLPSGVTEIVSGGAKGIDTIAREYAILHNIKLTEFLPQYEKYQRNAPLIRNEQIVKHSDFILAFWDGKSNGTAHTIQYAQKIQKEIKIIWIT